MLDHVDLCSYKEVCPGPSVPDDLERPSWPKDQQDSRPCHVAEDLLCSPLVGRSLEVFSSPEAGRRRTVCHRPAVVRIGQLEACDNRDSRAIVACLLRDVDHSATVVSKAWVRRDVDHSRTVVPVWAQVHHTHNHDARVLGPVHSRTLVPV